MYKIINIPDGKPVFMSAYPKSIIQHIRDNPGIINRCTRVDLRGADMECLDLSGMVLINVDFYKANLNNACFRGSKLQSCSMFKVNAMDADFTLSELMSVNLHLANLSRARLCSAVITDCDLDYTNFAGADLGREYNKLRLKEVTCRNTAGDGRVIKTLHTGKYTIVNYENRLQVGCENYTKAEWRSFSKDHIETMDEDALKIYRVWKPILIDMGWL